MPGDRSIGAPPRLHVLQRGTQRGRAGFRGLAPLRLELRLVAPVGDVQVVQAAQRVEVQRLNGTRLR